MKKRLLTLIAVLATFTAFAQSSPIGYDTVYVRALVTPFRASNIPIDTSTAVYLSVKITSDNLHDKAVLYFAIMSYDGRKINEGYYVVTGISYNSWNGNDNNAPFNFVSAYLQLPIYSREIIITAKKGRR